MHFVEYPMCEQTTSYERTSQQLLTVVTFKYLIQKLQIQDFVIQQIVTMPIYGKEALNICHSYITDILR